MSRRSSTSTLVAALASGVVLALSGCGLFSTIAPSPGSSTTASHSPASARDGIVAGYVRVCGGPAPGGCRIETFGICQPPEPCVSTDRVAVTDTRGRQVAEQSLRRARFRVRLRPGAYTVVLLGDGKGIHGRVIQRRQVTARAHHTATVAFFFAVP